MDGGDVRLWRPHHRLRRYDRVGAVCRAQHDPGAHHRRHQRPGRKARHVVCPDGVADEYRARGGPASDQVSQSPVCSRSRLLRRPRRARHCRGHDRLRRAGSGHPRLRQAGDVSAYLPFPLHVPIGSRKIWQFQCQVYHCYFSRVGLRLESRDQAVGPGTKKARLGPMKMRLQRGMLQKLWYERPVRTQLLIAVGAINLLAAVLAGAVSILNTRTATRVEIEASLEVAEHFVAATLKDISARDKSAQLNEELSLHLKNLRHVRIFMEARGTSNPLKRMTVRELQTLALVAEGKPYGVIAEHLHAVANTCTQLKAKLGV